MVNNENHHSVQTLGRCDFFFLYWKFGKYLAIFIHSIREVVGTYISYINNNNNFKYVPTLVYYFSHFHFVSVSEIFNACVDKLNQLSVYSNVKARQQEVLANCTYRLNFVIVIMVLHQN